MDLDQETAKELVKSVIDGFEEESIVNAESVTLFLCRECLPYLTKMNIPANIVQAVNGLAEKNEDLTAAGSLTDLVIAQDGSCLLYTSDAADDLLCVDLGGRRFIKKKKYNKQEVHDIALNAKHNNHQSIQIISTT